MATTSCRAQAKTPAPMARTRRQCLATGAGLVAAAARAQAGLAEEWNAFRARFITAEGRVVDTGNQGVSHSEGQGWGMMLAAAHDDRACFDLIRGWTRRTLKRPQDHLHAWRYRPDATPPVDDPNNATDGDLYIAWGLLMAAERWQHDPYRAEALLIARDLLRLAHRIVAGHAVLLPGVEGFESRAGAVLNPSYLVLPAFTALNRAAPQTGWSRLRLDGLDLLRRARFGAWGLSPDWVLQPPRAAAPLVLPERWPPRFSYDAVRVPLMLAWANETAHPALLGAHRFWTDPRWQVPPAWVDLVTGHTADYPAPGGMRAIAAYVAARIGGATEIAGLPAVKDSEDYYSASLILLVRLACLTTGLRIG